MDDFIAGLVGALIGSIWYGTCKTPPPQYLCSLWFILGIVITLFFQCMAALFDPVHRGEEGIKWGVVSYTMAVFSIVTVFTATSLGSQIPVFRGWIRGSYGIPSFALIPNIMLLLNYWLADGLLVGSLCLIICSLTYVPNALSSSSSTVAT